jgi:hypothetical protein
MRIASRQQLRIWLEEHGWFEDGFMSKISAPDAPLQLTIGYQVSGTMIAGNPKRTIEFDLIPQGVTLWNGPSTVDPEDIIEGVDMIDEGLGIEVDFPKIHLACAEIEVSEPRYLDTLTKPWTSDREVDVSTSGTVPPTPQSWIDAFHKYGLNVGFRYLGGVPPRKASGSGFPLQVRTRRSSSLAGFPLQSVTQIALDQRFPFGNAQPWCQRASRRPYQKDCSVHWYAQTPFEVDVKYSHPRIPLLPDQA